MKKSKKRKVPKPKNQKTPRRVHDLLDQLQWLFGFNNFDRSIILEPKDGNNLAAEIAIEEDYQRVTIHLYPTFFEHSLNDQRLFLLHEMCHGLTHDMHDIADKLRAGKVVTPEAIRHANEKSTSRIQNILHGLLQGRMRYARDAYGKYVDMKKG